MKINKSLSLDESSFTLAEELLDYVKKHPRALLCLAAGNTPMKTYEIFSEKVLEEKVDVSQLNFVSLDEWVDIEKENVGSCFSYLNRKLFKPLKIKSKQVWFFDKEKGVYSEQIKEVNKYIEDKGGIDFCILGVGSNGHIGFNEPGDYLSSEAHMIKLTENTIDRSKNYFGDENNYKMGVTLGQGQILRSKKLRVILSGEGKSQIFERLISGEITTQCPVTLINCHKNCIVYTDEKTIREKI